MEKILSLYVQNDLRILYTGKVQARTFGAHSAHNENGENLPDMLHNIVHCAYCAGPKS